jgi:NTP pyrophosphatase (non-canonical NTP hydrolase)
MVEEVRAVNTKLGWWDEPVRFKTAMTLLHSEVSEILEAWRRWEFVDKTAGAHWEWDQITGEYIEKLPKPEGFASEFADVLIRLLDDDPRFNLRLADFWGKVDYGFALWDAELVPDNLDDMHNLISLASVTWQSEVGDDDGTQPWRKPLGDLVVMLVQQANLYRVDLAAEYERKLKYNGTRPYRHGKAV